MLELALCGRNRSVLSPRAQQVLALQKLPPSFQVLWTRKQMRRRNDSNSMRWFFDDTSKQCAHGLRLLIKGKRGGVRARDREASLMALGRGGWETNTTAHGLGLSSGAVGQTKYDRSKGDHSISGWSVILVIVCNGRSSSSEGRRVYLSNSGNTRGTE